MQLLTCVLFLLYAGEVYQISYGRPFKPHSQCCWFYQFEIYQDVVNPLIASTATDTPPDTLIDLIDTLQDKSHDSADDSNVYLDMKKRYQVLAEVISSPGLEIA